MTLEEVKQAMLTLGVDDKRWVKYATDDTLFYTYADNVALTATENKDGGICVKYYGTMIIGTNRNVLEKNQKDYKASMDKFKAIVEEYGQ